MPIKNDPYWVTTGTDAEVSKSKGTTYVQDNYIEDYESTTKTQDDFSTVLYTGNGATGHAITGVGFQPDLVWLKNRDTTDSHNIMDSLRGPDKEINSNDSSVEITKANGLTSFDTDGFTVGNALDYNTSAENFVAWCWKADQDASHASHTGEKYNEDTGLSIIKYTGNGSAGHTINHSLGAKPDLIIIKNLSGVNDWMVYHNDLGATKHLRLNENVAEIINIGTWNDIEPTGTIFTLGTSVDVNNSGENHIAYLFAEKPGFSKFGSYTGNGSTSGPIIDCGFEPGFVMVKRTDSIGDWDMFDNVRGGNKLLQAQLSIAEYTDTHTIEFQENGFHPTSTQSQINASGGQYIYIAFAASSQNIITPKESNDNDVWYRSEADQFEIRHSNKWITDYGTGYLAGGQNSTSVISRLDFPFDSGTAKIIGNLSVGKRASAGNNSSQHGYICGGSISGEARISSVDKIDFPFNSGVASICGSLSSARAELASCNSSIYGYTSGGTPASGSHTSIIDRFIFPFAGGTARNIGNLNGSRGSLDSTNSSQHGFTYAGYDTTYRANINRIIFPHASGTASVVGSLSAATCLVACNNSSQYGFIIGGFTGSYRSIIDRIAFPFDSGTATIVGNLNGSRRDMAGNNSSQHGYICGGSNGSYLSNIDRFAFPFDSGIASYIGNLSGTHGILAGLDNTDFVSQFI